MNLEDLKGQIEYCLTHEPETRDSDRLLTWTLWQKFYNVGLTVSLDQFLRLPTQDAVKRYRAQFQNDYYMYLPRTEAVAIKRKLNIEKWRASLGYKQAELFRK